MAINELVEHIQAVFPPPGQIPPPAPSPREDSNVEGLSPIPRPTLPDWLKPGEGTPLHADSVFAIEGPTPIVQAGMPATVDVLAYYLPFHFYGEEWGIYLRASGVLSIASMLASRSKNGLTQDLLEVARGILLQHERFHFMAEVACARIELVPSLCKVYEGYFQDPYATTIEEALANAHAFRAVVRQQSEGIRKEVKQWMLSQGAGYSDFVRCLGQSAFTKYCRIAVEIMQLCRIAVERMQLADKRIVISNGGIRAGNAGMSFTGVQSGQRSVTRKGQRRTIPTEFLFAGLARSTAPTYVVLDVAGVGVLKPFPKYAGVRMFVHSNDHPPPHVHVEIPPGREVTRLEWPGLKPLPGDAVLSGSQRKNVEEYVLKYRAQIDEKIQQVYSCPDGRTA